MKKHVIMDLCNFIENKIENIDKHLIHELLIGLTHSDVKSSTANDTVKI